MEQVLQTDDQQRKMLREQAEIDHEQMAVDMDNETYVIINNQLVDIKDQQLQTREHLLAQGQ